MKPLLVLFDGHGLIHRAYHAFGKTPLTISRTGEEVSAVYGFALMLLKVYQELKPTHWAVAFDLPTPTLRHKIFPDYKAHRPPQPPELHHQVEKVRELVSAFNIPIYEEPGYEADDILGTLCQQTPKEVETIIVSGDADIMQLVSPKVRVLYPKPGRPFSETEFFDENKVIQKFGIPPSRLADLKALKGDPSDNIPGVPGIGEKTALELLRRFGSLEEIYRNLEAIEPQLRKTLAQNRESAFRSKMLATIIKNAPVNLVMENCTVKLFEREKVVRLFREWEFASLLQKLPQTVEVISSQPSFKTITEEEEFEDLLVKLSSASILAIDVETTGVGEMTSELVGISLCWQTGEPCYIPVGHHTFEKQLPINLVLERLSPILSNPSLPKVAHNGKFDMAVLSRYGININPLSFDTMIAAHILGERSLSLKSMAFKRLGVEMTPLTSLIGRGSRQISMAYVPVSQAAKYSSSDAWATLKLKEVLEEKLKSAGLENLFYEVEIPLIPVLLEMEKNGVLIDQKRLAEISAMMESEMTEIQRQVYQMVGQTFNLNSHQQLAYMLYERLKLPRSKRTKTGYSTDASVLEELREHHPVVGLISEYRQLSKLKSTYIDALPQLVNPETGRVHTSFHQAGTATGRISSSDPNLQNIPVKGRWGREIRRAFIPAPGYLFLSADYSQIELRILAHLSGDEGLIGAFLRDEDIHSATASALFNLPPDKITPNIRRIAKTINFGIIYGMSEYGLEQRLPELPIPPAEFISTYFQKYPKVKSYIDTTIRKARELGYVQTLLGRRRCFPEINSTNKQVREAAEREAINMPVQGTAAEVLKLAILKLSGEIKRRGLKSKLLLQVHDELLIEVPEEEIEEMEKLTAEVMSNALKLSVPLKVEVKSGSDWSIKMD